MYICRTVIYKMKEMISSIGGASGLIRFIQEIKRIDGVESGFISREDLVYTMNEFGIYITPTEYDILYEKFDIDGNSQVSDIYIRICVMFICMWMRVCTGLYITPSDDVYMKYLYVLMPN
jgi:hypothetical protein